MARVLKGSHSFICTPRVHPLTEWTIPAFAFPAETGTHLPTPEGWKAELALGGWLVTYWNRCPAPGIEPDTIIYLSTNRVRRRLTSLIKANVLTTTPDHQTVVNLDPNVSGYAMTLVAESAEQERSGRSAEERCIRSTDGRWSCWWEVLWRRHWAHSAATHPREAHRAGSERFDVCKGQLQHVNQPVGHQYRRSTVLAEVGQKGRDRC